MKIIPRALFLYQGSTPIPSAFQPAGDFRKAVDRFEIAIATYCARAKPEERGRLAAPPGAPVRGPWLFGPGLYKRGRGGTVPARVAGGSFANHGGGAFAPGRVNRLELAVREGAVAALTQPVDSEKALEGTKMFFFRHQPKRSPVPRERVSPFKGPGTGRTSNPSLEHRVFPEPNGPMLPVGSLAAGNSAAKDRLGAFSGIAAV
jgi:hypothetical protein